jgi:hypothetical protein
MSNSPDTAARALDWLRGRPNPFEGLVRPQRPDDRFRDLHVPGLLRAPRELLLAVIDAYRLTEYRAASDLRDSRVVTVLGARGAGKTHMLDALAHHGDDKAQLLVRPAYIDVEVPFEDYLLDQVVTTLQGEDLVHGGRPFLDIAAQLTRLLLRQTLRGLGPTDRLFAGGTVILRQRLRLLWGGGERLTNPYTHFALDLEDRTRGREVAQLATQHGLSPRLLYELLEAHVRSHERGEEVLSAVRRALYLAMARTTLLQDRDAFGQFLETDYTLPSARPFFRADLVRQQLHALVEVCALVQMPVVFALDNLEGSLAPQGRLNEATLRAFMDNLAQAVDHTRGLLFLLFAEVELWRQVRRTTHQFALDRIDQGVPLHAQGPVELIELKPPSPAELQQLIAERIGQQLQGCPDAVQLPEGFPYSPAFLTDLAGRSGMELRRLMMRLRDEYSRVVYGRSVPPVEQPKPAVDWGPILDRAWSEKLTAAGRKLADSLTSHASALHLGLRRLLQQVGPAFPDGWELVETRALTTIDGHSVYSQVTVLDWRAGSVSDRSVTDRSASSSANGSADVRVSIGLLLARGPGLPRDLSGKLADLADSARQADYLVVLWPRAADKDLVDVLSADTRKAWDKGIKRYRGAALRALSDDDLRKLLALPDWLDALQSLPEAPVPVDVLQNFVRQRCQTVLPLTLPPVPEKKTSDAN